MAQPLEDVYCTLLMSDSYLPGAAVLAHSLRDAGTKKKLAVLVTMDTLSADTIAQLKKLYDYLIPVDRIRTPSPANLYLMGRPDLSYAFTKIALWRQTQFRKIVYLDADVVALRALDELFDIDAPFAAAPDIGWPDAFNSGVMVISPDMGEYWALQTMAASGDSFDGADQGLLNQYFEHRPWQRLKFTYNCTPNAEYQWEPAYRYYKRDISAVHFIGKDKPWSATRSNARGVYGELLGRWWQVYDRHLRKEAHSEPTPTVDQRKFSAPVMEWDATRSEPPSQSKPEAANFPTAQYAFSGSRQLFKAPQYAEPPKDMWYKVPESRPKTAEQPKPIFPWEQQADRPKATRVFAEDLPPEPTPAPTHTFSTVHYDESEKEASDVAIEGVNSPESFSHSKSADHKWQAFQQSSVNAWDNIPGIENYVRAIMESQGGRQTKAQILQQTTGTEELSSPTLTRRSRRESLILTDFPTAVERPSLPVTPAPIRRPTFWGEERTETATLPAAEGVPDQTEWNPDASLEQLRRSSLVEIEHLTKDPHPDPPLRALPEHSVLEEEETTAVHHALSGGASSHGLGEFDGAVDHSISHITGLITHEQLEASGIARVDFAQSAGTSSESVSKSGSQNEGLFFTPQGFSSNTSSWSTLNASSSTSQHFSSSQHSSTTERTSSSGGQTIRSGNMTFTLPDFGKDDMMEIISQQENVLSPTQATEEEETRKGDGLF